MINLDTIPDKLAIVGRLTRSQLKSLRAIIAKIEFDDYTSDGFRASAVTDRDHRFAKAHGFYRAMKEALERNDYAMFESLTLRQAHSLRAIIEKVVADVERIGDTFAFSGYYAVQHNDTGIETNAQLCLIASNPDKHVMWSKHKGKRATMLIPKAGDIVYLNTNQEHALMIGKGVKPLQFYGVCFTR